ncbi:type I phosphomannose isomerase catalytic subunit [Thermodesulfobacteriota bacterium]
MSVSDQKTLYILKFAPFPQFLRFGGKSLYFRLNSEDRESGARLAETWELSGHPKHSSIVVNGALKGRTLTELCALYGCDLLGPGLCVDEANPFPIMLRFLDCRENLPPAVHPDDEYCKAYGLIEGGKTEAWYIIEADPGAVVYCGAKPGLTHNRILALSRNGLIFEHLKTYPTSSGDVFLVPSRRPHSIGAGNLVYEIQQTSNAIFPFDWLDWADKDEERRQSDLGHSVGIVDLEPGKPDKIQPLTIATGPNKHQLLTLCRYFCLEKFELTESRPLPEWESGFVILTCLKGRVGLSSTTAPDEEVFIGFGETALVPACRRPVTIRPVGASLVLAAWAPRDIPRLRDRLAAEGYKAGAVSQLGGYGPFNTLLQ